jgi:dTDP-4-amino-4,6-dideoxygalactose transaminase
VGLQRPRQNPEAVVGREHPPSSVGCTSATASRACGNGSNIRLNELQSAIGRIQLQRLPERTAARTRTALLLAEALADCPAERLPVARELGETSLMVLVHPPITPEQMAGYAEAVRSVVKRACRWGGS